MTEPHHCPEELLRQPPRWVRWLHPKFSIPAFLGLAVLSAPFVYRGLQLARVPDRGDPFDVEAFGTVEIDDADNAYVDYRLAVDALQPIDPTLEVDFEAVLDAGWEFAAPEVRRWVFDNHAALELWRRGTKKPDALYHQPRDLDFETLLPVVQELRMFARLANFEASRWETRGDVETAWKWHRAAFRASRHCGRHGVLIERLVGIACHAIAVDGILRWSRHEPTTAEMLQAAREQLTVDYQLTLPYSTTLKCEYMAFCNTLRRDDNLLDYLSLHTATAGSSEQIARVLMFLKHEPELSRRLGQHIYANWLDQADLPLWKRTPQTGDLSLFTARAPRTVAAHELPPTVIEAEFHRSLLARATLSAVGHIDRVYFRERARQAALVVTLAAQQRFLEMGEFPENNSDFPADLVTDWPADPLSASGAPLGYRRDGEFAVVWSVGEDGVDNGGDVGEYFAKYGAGDFGFTLRPPGADGPAVAPRLPDGSNGP